MIDIIERVFPNIGIGLLIVITLLLNLVIYSINKNVPFLSLRRNRVLMYLLLGISFLFFFVRFLLINKVIVSCIDIILSVLFVYVLSLFFFPSVDEIIKLHRLKKGKYPNIKAIDIEHIFWTTIGKLNCYMILAKKLASCPEKDSERLKCYKLMDKLNLMENQRLKYYPQMLQFYYSIGNVKKIPDVLNDAPKKYTNTSQYYFMWAFVHRSNFDFDLEKDDLLKGIDCRDCDDRMKLMIYNNISVNALSRNNKVEREKFLFLAYSLIDVDIRQGINVLINLMSYFAENKNYTEANKYFEEYNRIAPRNNKKDYIEWLNVKIVFYRQINDYEKMIDIQNQYNQIQQLFNLTEDEVFSLKVSELRMRFNIDYNWKDLFIELSLLREDYLKKSIEIKLHYIREMTGVIQESSTRKIFHSDFPILVNYFSVKAPDILKEIESNVNTIDPSLVFKFCYLKKEGLFIQMSFARSITEEAIRSKMNGLLDLISILNSNMLRSEELTYRLLFVDELLTINQQRGYYLKNGIDVAGLIEEYRDYVNAQLNESFILLKKARNDRANIEKMIQLAMYFVKWENDIEKAEELVAIFIRNNVSLNHYAPWIKRMALELNEIIVKKMHN